MIAYALLGLWFLLFLGLGFGTAFLATFTVENGLDQAVRVTPVGAVGPHGSRHPLPVSHSFIVAIPALARGGFELQPGETVSITYDMDDINFSEIAVEKGDAMIGQVIVNANPTRNRYHAPAQTHFVVTMDSLAPVSSAVSDAASRAQQKSYAGRVLAVLLLLPWPAILILYWLEKKHAAKVARGFS